MNIECWVRGREEGLSLPGIRGHCQKHLDHQEKCSAQLSLVALSLTRPGRMKWTWACEWTHLCNYLSRNNHHTCAFITCNFSQVVHIQIVWSLRAQRFNINPHFEHGLTLFARSSSLTLAAYIHGFIVSKFKSLNIVCSSFLHRHLWVLTTQKSTHLRKFDWSCGLSWLQCSLHLPIYLYFSTVVHHLWTRRYQVLKHAVEISPCPSFLKHVRWLVPFETNRKGSTQNWSPKYPFQNQRSRLHGLSNDRLGWVPR